jgi:hypothetical protein
MLPSYLEFPHTLVAARGASSAPKFALDGFAVIRALLLAALVVILELVPY